MPQEEKIYNVLIEGNEIVSRLRQKYPKILWAVIPDHIVVIGVMNKDRPKTQKKLAFITKINPAMRTIIKTFGNREVKYVIEVYGSEFMQWSNTRKQWLILHELLHVPGPNGKGLLDHDVEDQAVILDAVGIDWWSNNSLPDLLGDDAFPFREELALRLHGENNGDAAIP